jgi:hypothetical protein
MPMKEHIMSFFAGVPVLQFIIAPSRFQTTPLVRVQS